MTKRSVKTIIAAFVATVAVTGAFFASSNASSPKGTEDFNVAAAEEPGRADTTPSPSVVVGCTHGNWGEWTADDNGTTHSRVCLEADCDGTGSESHTFVGDECSKCRYKKSQEGGNNPGTDDNETDNHENHDNWGKWVADDNGDTHSRVCLMDGCGVVEARDHTFEQGNVCSVCGYRKPVYLGSATVDDDDDDDSTPSNSSTSSGSTVGVLGLGDLTNDTSDADLANYIDRQPNSSVIGIQCSVSYTLSIDVFSAIQSTNKTIVLRSGSVQWTFNGRDIRNPKTINLKVDVSLLQYTTSNNRQQISRLMGSTPASVLSFANNGTLPGKATIHVNKNDLFPNTRQNSFFVYHFNEAENRLDPIARNLRPSADGYLSFDITHNSDYIVTESELTNLDAKGNPHTGA